MIFDSNVNSKVSADVLAHCIIINDARFFVPQSKCRFGVAPWKNMARCIAKVTQPSHVDCRHLRAIHFRCIASLYESDASLVTRHNDLADLIAETTLGSVQHFLM